MDELFIIDNTTLSIELEKIFRKYDNTLKGFAISERKPAFNSTFKADIVTCTFENTSAITVWCKYSQGIERNQEGGHRGGVQYEREIYKKNLTASKLPLAKYIGSFSIHHLNILCLVIEYISNCTTLNKSQQPDCLLKAVNWIARFHTSNTPAKSSFEKKYDENYYRQWVNYTMKRGNYIKEKYPLIYHICDYFADNIKEILTFPTTLIHGEYYPQNILIKDDTVYPIDWESAAIAFGEIDLASLIKNWDTVTVEFAINTYKRLRWQNLSATEENNFRKRLKFAQIYLQLRWIGSPTYDSYWQENQYNFKEFHNRLNLLYKFFKD